MYGRFLEFNNLVSSYFTDVKLRYLKPSFIGVTESIWERFRRGLGLHRFTVLYLLKLSDV